MKPIYMDYNACTPPTQHILNLADRLQREYWYNPNSAYNQGRMCRKLINKAREQCANAIGADPEQILFTSCASESNTMVLPYGAHSSPFEHTDILENVEVWTMPESQFNSSDFTSDTDLFSLMLVNNESGRIFDVKKYADYIHSARDFGIFMVKDGKIHSDMSQAFGKIPIDVKDLDIDFATFSSQKIGSIRGCSVLYIKDPKTFKEHYEPLIYGHQENGMRGGTENTVAIACMGEAMERYNYNDLVNDLYIDLKRRLVNGLTQIPDAVILNVDTDMHKFTNNVVQVSFKGIESESLVLMCDSYGLCISGGAACNSGSLEPSNEVKYLCGLHDPDTVNPYGVVRISYGASTTMDDINKTIDIIRSVVTNLRAINKR